MASHAIVKPHHEGKRAHAREIVQKLEARLGRKSVEVEGGHRFELDEDDPERAAVHFSGALDEVAPDWSNHVSMGL